ncbi:glycosyltransferase [Rothia sp. P6271]|uniref:glycosyltransferase n=1 Tax=unclassified Rothia (in: high G+C Gram-positive bacteria) TaxID=2689056 RepID=UPI003AD77271
MSTETVTMKTLQRVIFPERDQTDTIPLYVDSGIATGVQLSHVSGALTSNDSLDTVKTTERTDSAHLGSQVSETQIEDFIGRGSTLIRSGTRLSFATYFNAFPASYWKRWTPLTSVRLQTRTNGTGTIVVYKSNARGSIQRVDSKSLSGKETTEFDLTLKPFGDGGWYWFELIASGEDNLILHSAQWLGEDNGKTAGKITLQITTMNKQDFCLDNLRLLAKNPEVLENLQEILIVDQGSQKLQDAEGFEEVAAQLPGKLRIINQGNLGGSGGFARGMYEAVENGSDYALLLDDDVVVEPESIIRLLTFADMCRKPTIVGGHMFDLYNRTVLHTFGEVVNRYRFQPSLPHADQFLGHDFLHGSLRNTPWLHRRTDVDYNGWWMDLIPTQVIKEIGLSLPIFIKWDDVEYGLRAKEAGYHTVSLPGAAVWHVSWADKDDLVGWQAYFHIRNRIITSLLHSPYERGGKLLQESSFADVKHLISMQYFTEHGRIMALRDILQGPEQLHTILSERLPQIRELVQQYSDAQFKEDIESFPEPKMHKPPRNGRGFAPPSYKSLVPWAVKTLAKQIVKPVEDTYKNRPQAHIAHLDNRWWRMSQYDSVLVSNAEGSAVSWYKRDPQQLRSKLVESTKLTAQILKSWPQLRQQYRAAATELTSFESWKKTFDQHTESEITR